MKRRIKRFTSDSYSCPICEYVARLDKKSKHLKRIGLAVRAKRTKNKADKLRAREVRK